MLFLRKLCIPGLLLALSVGVGCSESPNPTSVTPAHDHDHDGHGHSHGPETLKDAISELTSLRDTIRDAFAKNDLDTADKHLHEVGHILESIPELAKKEQVSDENQEAAKVAVSTLMNAFGNVDKTMHGQEGSTYSEESETIDKALTELTVACGLAAAADDAAAEAAPAEKSETQPEGSSDSTENTP